MDVYKGDVIAVIEPMYIDFPGGLYRDHFVNKKKYYKAIETSSNNGNFKAVDSIGRLKWFNTLNVSIARRH